MKVRPPAFNPEFTANQSETTTEDSSITTLGAGQSSNNTTFVPEHTPIITNAFVVPEYTTPTTTVPATTVTGAGSSAGQSYNETSGGSVSYNPEYTTAQQEEDGVSTTTTTTTAQTTGGSTTEPKTFRERTATKVKEYDKKYHVTRKTKAAITTVVLKTKEFDKKYQVSQKTKRAASTTLLKTKESIDLLKKKLKS